MARRIQEGKVGVGDVHVHMWESKGGQGVRGARQVDVERCSRSPLLRCIT